MWNWEFWDGNGLANNLTERRRADTMDISFRRYRPNSHDDRHTVLRCRCTIRCCTDIHAQHKEL